MGLYERLTSTEDDKIPVHVFSAYLHIWLTNSEGLGSVAGSRFATNFAIDAEVQAEATAIKTKYDAITHANAGVQAALKNEFVRRIHHGTMLAEAGEITKAELKTLLGF